MFRSPRRQHDSEAARSRVEHLEENVQQNVMRLLYGANGQSPEACLLGMPANRHGTGNQAMKQQRKNERLLICLPVSCLLAGRTLL
jgi:hypothetical protein